MQTLRSRIEAALTGDERRVLDRSVAAAGDPGRRLSWAIVDGDGETFGIALFVTGDPAGAPDRLLGTVRRLPNRRWGASAGDQPSLVEEAGTLDALMQRLAWIWDVGTWAMGAPAEGTRLAA